MNINFTSDYHFGHENVLIHNPETRIFDNIFDMEDKIIANHNMVVSDKDHTYNLGDVGFRCSAEYIVERLKRLNGKQHIILGNHDKPLRQAYNKGLLNGLIKSGKVEIIGGVDKSIATIKTIKHMGQTIVLSHYAIRSWPGAFRDAWHLYGHSHGNLSGYYKSFDVGVDNQGLKPISFDQVKLLMDIRKKDFQES